MTIAGDAVARARARLSGAEGFAFFVAASLVAKLLLARYFALGSAFGAGAFVDSCAIAAAVALCSLAPGKARRPALTALAIVLPLVMLAGVVYASYFGELPSAGMLSASGELGAAREAAAGLLRWSYVLFVIDWPVLLLGPARGALRRPASRRPALAVLAAAIVPPLVATAVCAALPKPLNSLRITADLGLAAYAPASLIPPVAAASADKHVDVQQQADVLTGHAPAAPRLAGAPAAGSMKGKNVLLIQMESMQAGLIGARLRGKPIVPNLEKLVAESVYFPNAYSQIGRGNTSDAEFVMNTSLYPASDEPSAIEYAGKQLPGLPRLLAAQGYQTMTMHTNKVTYWNRNQLYPALGFEALYDKAYFGSAESAMFGASDHVLYERSLPLLKSAAWDGPFMAQIITSSAHYPFTNTGGRTPLRLPKEFKNTETGRYLEAQAYADKQLGAFLAKLESSGQLDNTILVVCGDHFGMRLEATKKDAELRKEILGHAYNAADFYNVPLIVRVPGGKPAREEAVVGQIDVMPTVADLLGIDISTLPHFGRSVFVDSPTLLTRSSSVDTYISDDIAYFRGLTKGDGAYSPVTKEPLADAHAPKDLGRTRELVELSHRYASALPSRVASETGPVGYVPAAASKVEQTPYR